VYSFAFLLVFSSCFHAVAQFRQIMRQTENTENFLTVFATETFVFFRRIMRGGAVCRFISVALSIVLYSGI